MKYFWTSSLDWPPPAVEQIEEHRSGRMWAGEKLAHHPDRLAVACTQTRLSAARQRALVRRWCEVLPTMEDVRFIWFTSKVPQDLFDAACAMPNLEGLYIKWSGIKDASALQSARHLRYLHIGSSTGLQSIEPIARLKNLLWLGLENLKLVQDIEPLRSLIQLEGLHLEGSVWTAQRVRSIAPLSELANLRYLSVYNLRGENLSLKPLAKLRRLEWLFCPGWFHEDEFDCLLRENPTLHIQCAGTWYCKCDSTAHV